MKDHTETEINSLLDVQIQQEIPLVLSAPLLDVLVSIIPPHTNTKLTPLTTPIPTPPITSTIPPVTSSLPATKTLDAPIPPSEALTTVLQRVSTLKKDVKELKQVDHSIVILESIRSQVPPTVNKYLGSSLRDSLQKVLQKHTEELKQELKQQESQKSASKMIKIKQEHASKQIRTIDQSAGGKLCDHNAKESWALLEDLALYDKESWNDPRDFAKPDKAISLPQDVPSTSDRRLIELENQIQRLMEAHIAPMQPTQVNKITSSCEICSGPHDTQYCIENPEQAFVEYASSRTDEAGGLVSNFMASHDARLSKFEADFKQQQSEMTNKINTVLKAIIDRMAGALPSDTVKNPKLNVNSTSLASNDEEIEWLDVEEPLDLVETSKESVYESMIKEMPKCSLNYDFRIKKGDPRNLKIPCMIGHKFTANAYINVDLPMNIMSLAYYNSIRKKGYEYWGRNFIALGRDMYVFVGNMSYVIDFTILENIETNIDPSLSHVVFGRPFVDIACLDINKKHGLMTFMDEIKEVTFKTPYKDPKRSELFSEGHDLLSSRIILSEDDYDRGCRKPSDLEDGFYRDTTKLGPEYVTSMDDEGEVT
ncbi:hypothetical protein Tco_1204033 [Tanacetum coccineum]